MTRSASGDNDRLAALVAHLIDAETLVLLTDTPGVLTADPRLDPEATLIEEIVEVDAEIERLAGGASDRGSGGMASKLAAAKIAAWTGVRTVIAEAGRPGVVADAIEGAGGVGTVVQPRKARLPARKRWIAFARGQRRSNPGRRGSPEALISGGRSLLPIGVSAVEGDFEAEDAVEILDAGGSVFAKGLVRVSSTVLREIAGVRSGELPAGVAREVRPS